MTLIKNMVQLSHVNSNSLLEQVGDLLLAPTRYLLKGSSFVVLSNQNEKLYYTSPGKAPIFQKMGIISPNKPNASLEKFMNGVHTIGCIAGVVLFPLGLLLKSTIILNQETKALFSNITDIIPCDKKTPESLSALYNRAKEKNMLQSLYNEIVNNPIRYLTYGVTGFCSPTYTFSPLEFRESTSINGTFNRLFSKRRQNLERKIIENIKQQVPEKETRIQLLSLGSGELLQDWIILGKLIQEGYEHIDIALVDPGLNEESSSYKNFLSFFQDLGVDVQVSLYTSMNDVPEKSFHAGMAIDFNPLLGANSYHAWKDLIHAKNSLKDGGTIALGYCKDDILLSKTSFNSIKEQKGIAHFIYHGVLEKKVSLPFVSLALADVHSFLFSYIPLIEALIQQGRRNIRIDLLGQNDASIAEILQEFFNQEGVTITIEQKKTLKETMAQFDYIFTGIHESTIDITKLKEHMHKDSSAYVFTREGLEKRTLSRTKTITF